MSSATGAEPAEDALRRLRAGDAAAYDELYDRFGRPLYGTALRMLGKPEDAEDAMQEAFLALYRKAPDMPTSQCGSWLHRVLVNHCIDHGRILVGLHANRRHARSHSRKTGHS